MSIAPLLHFFFYSIKKKNPRKVAVSLYMQLVAVRLTDKNASESKQGDENPRTVLLPIRGASIDPRRLLSADSSTTSPAAGETLHTAKHRPSRWETLPTIAASHTCIPRLVTAISRKPQTFSYFCIKRHNTCAASPLLQGDSQS